MPTLKKEVRVLAIDPATNCGWATKNGFGVWNLQPKRDESIGFRLIRFRAALEDLCKLEKINVIFFERPGGQHKAPIIVQSELQGVIKVYCEDNKIEYHAVSSQEIKKFATGKGNAGKPAMIAAAQEKLKYKGDNDNEADALWIYQFAKNMLNL